MPDHLIITRKKREEDKKDRGTTGELMRKECQLLDFLSSYFVKEAQMLCIIAFSKVHSNFLKGSIV